MHGIQGARHVRLERWRIPVEHWNGRADDPNADEWRRVVASVADWLGGARPALNIPAGRYSGNTQDGVAIMGRTNVCMHLPASDGGWIDIGSMASAISQHLRL